MARGAPPWARRRETIRVRGGEPSVRKPSLAIREGALGYRTPQLLPLLRAQWPPWRLPRARGQNTPPPHLPSGGGGGRVRRPRGGAVCRSLPTAARASPLRVGGGSRWAPPGVPAGGGGPERACAACARGRPPRCGEPWGKGGEGVGGATSGRPRLPQPRSRGAGEPIAPALSPRAAAGGGVRSRSGPPRSRA